MSAAGFVLVGGKSSRMGRDKALLPWSSGVLVQEIAARVAQAAGSVTLVGSPEAYHQFGYPCIPDLRPGCGPLSGLEAVLSADLAERNLVLSCDVPGVSTDHLQAMLKCAAPSVVTQDETGQLHPLCAVYHRSCLPMVQNALDQKRLRLMDLIVQIQPAFLRYPGTLANINTLEDLASAR